MKIGIVGSQTLTAMERTTAVFILDSILSRYPNSTLILGGREGIEALTESLAKRRKWKNITHVDHPGGKWVSFMRKGIDFKIAEECEMLIAIEPRDYASNYAAKKAHELGKVAWEIYI